MLVFKNRVFGNSGAAGRIIASNHCTEEARRALLASTAWSSPEVEKELAGRRMIGAAFAFAFQAKLHFLVLVPCSEAMAQANQAVWPGDEQAAGSKEGPVHLATFEAAWELK